MKHIISVLAILQLVTSRPQHNNETKITSYENVNDGNGNFKIAFQTTNGIKQQQTGELKFLTSTTTATAMKGFYSVTAPDNSMLEVHYVSDENGYQSRFSITASNSSALSTRSSEKQEGGITGVAGINIGKQKTNNEASPHQTVFMPTVVYSGNTTANSTNQTKEGEFPDRIGTPAIITLMGPPG